MNVEMQQLRHFSVLADIKHFGRAAQALSLSQPALSRSIRNLEERLRVRLLVRSRSGVELTPHGEMFLKRARYVLTEVNLAFQDIESTAGRIAGSATIGVTPSFDDFVIPDVLADLVSRSVNVHLSIRSGFYEELLTLVRTGEIDLALALLPEIHGHPDVHEEILLAAPVGIYCRPQHPLARRQGLTFIDVADHAWVVPDQPTLRLLERRFETSTANRPRYVIRTASMHLLISTLTRCDLLSLLPDYMAAPQVAAGALVRLDLISLGGSLEVAIVTRKRDNPPVVARSIADGIRQTFRELRGTKPKPARSRSA